MIRSKTTYSLTCVLMLTAFSVHAETCLAPLRPLVPSDAATAKEFAELLRSDFEFYLSDIQDYFRCLDVERSRAFKEAQDVSQEYGQFLKTVRQ